MSIPIQGNIPSIDPTTFETQTQGSAKTGSDATVPDINKQLASLLDEKNKLAGGNNLIASQVIAGLSLTDLIGLVKNNNHKTNLEAAMKSLEAQDISRKSALADRLEKLNEQIEKIAEQQKEKEVSKVSSWFGAIFSFIGAVVSIVLGAVACATGAGAAAGAAMIAGGVIGLLCAADQITSLASDGEMSIAQEIVKCAKKNGSNVEAAAIAGQLMMVALNLGSALLSGAGGGAQAIANIANAGSMAAKVAQIANIADQIGNIGGLLASIVGSSAGIAEAFTSFDIAKDDAKLKEVAAILKRLQDEQETLEELAKSLVELNEKMTSAIMDIISNVEETMSVLSQPQSFSRSYI